MTVLSLKTELDVAKTLLAEGWFPEEINGILVFPLPRAAFCQLNGQNYQVIDSDIVQAAGATPTTLYRARQLLQSAGWLDKELNSLLKPYLYSLDSWANQTLHAFKSKNASIYSTSHLGCMEFPGPPLGHHRRTMALRRIGSLSLAILAVSVAVVFWG